MASRALYRCRLMPSSRLMAQAPTGTLKSSISSSTGTIRTMVYLKDASKRARGLKKDETEYLTVNGILYPGNEQTLAPVKEFLGSKYQLPDDLALQVITHKSFAHGKKPYNENLAIIGREFLRLHTADYAVSRTASSSAVTKTAVNDKNFDLSTKSVDILSSSAVTSEVCKLSGISKHLFWKKRSEGLSEKESGAHAVYSKTIFALTGAVLLKYGQVKAKEFIDEKLLSGPYSVVSISSKFFQQ